MTTIDTIMKKLGAVPMMEGDYTGEDGIIHCGVCHMPKQKRWDSPLFTGKLIPILCSCERKRRAEAEAIAAERNHLDTVDTLRKGCFTDPIMRTWTFERCQCPQMEQAKRYVDRWEENLQKNIGLLLWGAVGTGKSYLAGCIANALIEQEIQVRMTNFGLILNDLMDLREGRNEFIRQLCRYPLLILDDFGMERDTAFALEQMFVLIDSRYRSRKPLIITTNLDLGQIQTPADLDRARIYSRVLEMCVPLLVQGKDIRDDIAQKKMDTLKGCRDGI